MRRPNHTTETTQLVFTARVQAHDSHATSELGSPGMGRNRIRCRWSTSFPDRSGQPRPHARADARTSTAAENARHPQETVTVRDDAARSEVLTDVNLDSVDERELRVPYGFS
ncbi:hypothetical protein Acy02nite_72170 [Actinoplanes cyaneus]|uniref:Uncharacterized protein n=1 Tax=Actinoplanes cyaneus TaxID=52696 RepID=A0A919MFL4_9ACTN|nr:hypothetical protein Acy02nite_72170 [Actinoplanes cyaneus]